MHNIAQYYWCGMYSVLKSRRNEIEFFASYLQDRILYSYLLGQLSRFPRQNNRLLLTGDNLNSNDIERLLRFRARVTLQHGLNLDQEGDVEKGDNKTRLVDQMVYGALAESQMAERYPTIRWNFDSDGYVLVGIPDGITDTFVYEFKTTKKRFFLPFIKPVAFTQADFMDISLSVI